MAATAKEPVSTARLRALVANHSNTAPLYRIAAVFVGVTESLPHRAVGLWRVCGYWVVASIDGTGQNVRMFDQEAPARDTVTRIAAGQAKKTEKEQQAKANHAKKDTK